MARLEDIPNEFIRQELEEFVEREHERRHLVNLYAPAKPLLLELAAAIIDGEHHVADTLTQTALQQEIGALEIMDDGLIAGMALVGIKFRENFIFVPGIGLRAGDEGRHAVYRTDSLGVGDRTDRKSHHGYRQGRPA